EPDLLQHPDLRRRLRPVSDPHPDRGQPEGVRRDVRVIHPDRREGDRLPERQPDLQRHCLRELLTRCGRCRDSSVATGMVVAEPYSLLEPAPRDMAPAVMLAAAGQVVVGKTVAGWPATASSA